MTPIVTVIYRARAPPRGTKAHDYNLHQIDYQRGIIAALTKEELR